MSYLAFAREMLGNLFKAPATGGYPLQPKEFPDIDRGRVVNNIGACIFCGLCMRNCPSGAITVDRAARTWSIDRFACVQCRGCVEHCPKKCLRMEPRYMEPARKKATEILRGGPLPPPRTGSAASAGEKQTGAAVTDSSPHREAAPGSSEKQASEAGKEAPDA